MNVATGDAKYKGAVARQRKLAAAALWSERLRLYDASAGVLSALQKAPAGRPMTGRNFKQLDQVRRTNGEKYLYFEDWWELKTIVEDGRKRVTPEVVSRARQLHDRVATASVWRNRS